MLRQLVRAHPRLLVSIAIGVALWFILPETLAGSTRAILCLDVGGVIFLTLAWTMMARANTHHMQLQASLQDEGIPVVLILTVGTMIFSLSAIALELHGLKSLGDQSAWRHVGLAASTLIVSWLVTHTIFALHYAHQFYGADRQAEEDGGLQFPSDLVPEYGDFLYFSFVVGMTCQTSDVQVSGKTMRRLCLAQGVVAFFFNTVILALSINIAAGLL